MNQTTTTTTTTLPTLALTREQGLDKFYTIPLVVDRCIASVVALYNLTSFDIIVEPSAGNGAFLFKLPPSNTMGLDIAPEHPSIRRQDFFQYQPQPCQHPLNVLVAGNPPFGRNCSLAIRFFNHAASFANVVAFIIPRTFRKCSVQNKLDARFHLVFDEDLQTKPCAFVPPMAVKCCFQIWQKDSTKLRPKTCLPTQHSDWEFVKNGPLDFNGQPTPPVDSEFAIRAYGGRCGDIVTCAEHLLRLRPKSWHFVRTNGAVSAEELVHRFNQLDYSNSCNTARQNSLGRGELVRLYTEFVDAEAQ